MQCLPTKIKTPVFCAPTGLGMLNSFACIWNSQFTGCCSKWQMIKLAFFFFEISLSKEGHESSWRYKAW